MRLFRFATTLVANIVLHGRRWLFVGVVASATCPTVFAETTQSDRASRLGFRFDQAAHDAAIAAEQKSIFPSDEPVDADVVRLPKYQVTEQRMPLEDYELLTPKGRVEVAKSRYLAPLYQKTLGPLAAVASLLNNPLGGWNPNGPEAMAIYEDNENLRRRNRINELSELAKFSDQVKKSKTGASREPAASAKKR